MLQGQLGIKPQHVLKPFRGLLEWWVLQERKEILASRDQWGLQAAEEPSETSELRWLNVFHLKYNFRLFSHLDPTCFIQVQPHENTYLVFLQGPPGEPGPAGPPGPPGPPTAAAEDLYAVDYDAHGEVQEAVELGEYDDTADPPPPPEFNKDEAKPNNNILGAETGVRATLKTLNGHLQNLRSPDGSKTNPAKTCQDIRQCYPQKRSGQGHAACFLYFF